MSVPTRFLLATTLGVVVVLLAFSAMVYGGLPEQIPRHFNGAGIPDGFGPKSGWWFLPAICVASTALTVGITLFLPGRPDLLNVPNKAEILALPRQAQLAVLRRAQPGLMAIACMVATVFLVIQYGIWQVTQGRPAGLGGLIVIVPVVSLALIPAILIPVSRELQRQQAALKPR